jgi:hypothetical protein
LVFYLFLPGQKEYNFQSELLKLSRYPVELREEWVQGQEAVLQMQQDLLGDVDIIVPVTRPSRCMVFVVLGVGVGVCPSIYWYMLLIPINDDATESTIIDTEVFPNMVLGLSCTIKR